MALIASAIPQPSEKSSPGRQWLTGPRTLGVNKQDKDPRKYLGTTYDLGTTSVSSASFGPSFSGHTGATNLRIPRYALPHEELSSLNDSLARDSHSGLSSCALSGSTRVQSRDCDTSFSAPTSAPMLFEPSNRLPNASDFTTLGYLGKGAHGQVLLVHDEISHQALALKVVGKDHLHLSSYPRIFEEQLVGKKLTDCSWALRLEASFQDNESFYFLTRYYPGGDLTKLVRRYSKLPTSVARFFAAELIAAVEELHRREIMHRDLKPDNILIDDKGHLILADFGVSRSFGDSASARPWEQYRRWARTTEEERSATPDDRSDRSRTFTSCGTPGFMAPETFGNDAYSYEADVWSAGVVIHFLLLGRLPFGMIPAKQTHKELSTRTKVLQLEFGMDERVPGHARMLLRRMLEKDPTRRISISEIKQHPFFAGIDWEIVAQRKMTMDSPLVLSYLHQKLKGAPLEDATVVNPSGTQYKPGECPFPWFNYASPTLNANESSQKEAIESVAPDPSHSASPRPRRKASLANKFKGLWKRNATTDRKP